MKRFAPKEQSFRIDPRVSNTITGKRGTRIFIGERAFDLDYDSLSENDAVEIRLVEAIDAFDFAGTGLEMDYTDEFGQRRRMESAGMFRLTARYDVDDLELDGDTTIDVQFPDIAPGEKYRTYRFGSGKWKYDDLNLKTESENRSGKVRAQNPTPGRTVGVRRIQIDELTWWQFAYPRVETACLKGEIQETGEVEFHVLGRTPLSYHFSHGRQIVAGEGLLRSEITALAISVDGRTGIKRLASGELWGNFREPESPHNHCEQLGVLELSYPPEDALKDRESFRKFLGIPEDSYRVNYEN